MDADTDENETWNTRLLQCRNAKKFTQEELGATIGVAGPTISGWETGKTKKIDAADALSLCRVLEIRVEWLMEKRGPKTWGSSSEEGDSANIPAEMCKLMRLTESESQFVFTLRKLDTKQRSMLYAVANSIERESN